MATLSPAVSIQDPKLGHGGSGAHPPVSDGGGDGRGENGAPDYGARLRRARLGVLLLLVTVTMLFVAFTSAYIFRQGLPVLDERTGKNISDWVRVDLPTGLLVINTLLLLLSSITVEFARRQITQEAALAPVQSIPGILVDAERSFPWLAVTTVLGFGFLAGQWIAWRELQSRGFYLATSPSSSFVYLLTAAHAIHLSGGIVALLYAGVTSLLRRPVELRRIVVDITAWYWHFMALLWIYIFALLEFAP
jgi:cytochrome c oxidase subunit III